MKSFSRVGPWLTASILLASTTPAWAQGGADQPDVPPTTMRNLVGTKKGNLAFSGGGQYLLTSPQGTAFLHGQIEYQVTDLLGFRGYGGLPMGKGPSNTMVLPGFGGMTLHLLPRSRFDLYLGGGGGFAIVTTDKFGGKLVPALAMSAGARFYLAPGLFLQGEGGYQFMSYAGKNFYTDLSGLFFNGHGGFYF